MAANKGCKYQLRTTASTGNEQPRSDINKKAAPRQAAFFRFP
jgi:hypothetical protein